MLKSIKFKIESIVFITGLLFMILEILGGRVLTPFYGDSVFVWGSIIGIFMLSLSAGYYFGGKLADKRPEEYILSLILMSAGIFILITPFIYKPIINLFSNLPQSTSVLFASLGIFLVPSLLLGMVSPYAIKLKAKSLDKIGKLSGNLYSIATLGSVIGAFAATFIIIPLTPIRIIFFLIAAALFAAAIIASKKNSLFVFILLFVVVFAAYSGNITGAATEYDPAEPLNITVESPYGQVIVADRIFPNVVKRAMWVNGGLMSQMTVSNTTPQNRLLYTDCLEIPFSINPDIDKVLSIGLGGGTFQKIAHNEYGAKVDSVDINPVVVDLAQKYFNVKPSKTFRLYADDGRVFLKNTDEKYDYIVIDVILHDPEKGYKLAYHLATKEFFELAKEHLNENGIVTMNFVSNPKSDFLKSEFKTMNSVFNNIYPFHCNTNMLIALDEEYNVNELDKQFANRFNDIQVTEDTIVLTDEYFPINMFKELIQEE